ncbi:germin-like protein 9-3 [Juglans microcarpa x Juglans regia]|uniref:germin-like protein 9-3 n=1 Tax=Juglans microcarpa x Juglans regia TaxID=2249226 RepID=UPI001B7F6828|nr:germin-like protein 9-3 [Juglans microcarpa x Juglans regia]
MASTLLKNLLLSLLVVSAGFWVAKASDPDILFDFVAPANSTNNFDGNYFTFIGLRGVLFNSTSPNFKVTKASMAEFPALKGQSVSFAILQYPAGGLNPPHTHPRSAELLFLVQGSLQVGFVDTTNKLYNQTLQVGDMFIFPKGLVHFQYNANTTGTATAVSAFGSANAGTISIPANVFTTGIDDVILAKAFKTDIATIQNITAGLITPKT